MLVYIYHGKYNPGDYGLEMVRFQCPKCGLDFACDNYQSYFDQVCGKFCIERPCPECGVKIMTYIGWTELIEMYENWLKDQYMKQFKTAFAMPGLDLEAYLDWYEALYKTRLEQCKEEGR